MTSKKRWLFAITSTVLLLAACKGKLSEQGDDRQASASPSTSPSPANEPRIKNEQEFLQANFAKSSCMQSIRQTPSANAPEQAFLRDAYSVVIVEENAVVDHPIQEELLVRKSDNTAYLVRSGGLIDSSTYFGPISIASCMSHQ